MDLNSECLSISIKFQGREFSNVQGISSIERCSQLFLRKSQLKSLKKKGKVQEKEKERRKREKTNNLKLLITQSSINDMIAQLF